jgi:hypothetical protein
MSNNKSSRIFAGLTIFLCAIVLLISVAGVIGTWVAGRAVSDAAVQLLNGVDQAAGAARTMIGEHRGGASARSGDQSQDRN